MSTHSLESNILIVNADKQINFLLERILKSAGHEVCICEDNDILDKLAKTRGSALVMIGENIGREKCIHLIESIRKRFPVLPILLFVDQDSHDLLKNALKAGISDYMCLPLRSDEIMATVQSGLEKTAELKKYVLLESQKATKQLQQRVSELETLSRLGRSVTSSLDLDSVLASIVDAAVEVTGAEEGSLLLLDDETGELYVRASRNFNDEFVQTFRLPIDDTLAGKVIQTGKPVTLDENTPKKIKTSYLVHSLIYVPLTLNDKVFGVLGVDNRNKRLIFRQDDVSVLSAMAEFAVIAIENARLYDETNSERNKLETILTRIQDGVLVLDHENRIMLVNQTAISALKLPDLPIIGQPIINVLDNIELLGMLEVCGQSISNRTEVIAEDGRVFNAILTPIPEVGIAMTFHDVTYLKKLDHIKSEFVSTVSHDLRSPLTAIMGYVELIDRAGPVTELQLEFIHRVQASVQNITNLVNDLVNLGRIEAGFDERKELINLQQIINLSIENFQKQINNKHIKILVDIKGRPELQGNPIQIRQMIDHLMDNAIKYSSPESDITIQAISEQNQIIFQITDTGCGIPPVDLPFIFDKFYRSGNISSEIPGTGLGLAIVKSIVEKHLGRIWVDSALNVGSTFTIVLPANQ